ncbi:MAG: glycosyltransferase family 9 protein [Candidatus Eisenbacteria bacterium]|nr:glycosyltransferase family 9 protein [Candidatus Eisenbacteria bacterium]
MAERILISRLRYMGDVVLTTPCVRRLRDNFPDAKIDYLTQAPYGELLLENPFLNEIISVDFRRVGTFGSLRLMWKLLRARYDLAIDLLSNPRSALLTASTLARRRVGTYHLSRSWAYNLNVRVPLSVRSAVEHHLEHLRALGLQASASLPELFVNENEKREGARLLKEAGAQAPARTVLLQPGAKWQAKRWPSKRFAELARAVSANGLRAALLAGPGEEAYTRSVLSGRPEFPVVSGLGLRQLARVLSAAAGYVGNDGGPAHVSAALGKPTVSIFGPSEPDIWFPYGSGGKAVCVYAEAQCRPCHLHFCEHVSCLEAIGVERVASEIRRLVDWA